MRIGVDVQPGAHNGEAERSHDLRRRRPPALARAPDHDLKRAPVPFGVESYEIALEEEGGAPRDPGGRASLPADHDDRAEPARGHQPARTRRRIQARSHPAGAGQGPQLQAAAGADRQPHGDRRSARPRSSYETIEGKENALPRRHRRRRGHGHRARTGHGRHRARITEPIFNLEPRVGEPARFGFYVVIANSPVFIDTSVRTGSDYGVTVNVQNITQTAAFLSSEVDLLGRARRPPPRPPARLGLHRGSARRRPLDPALQPRPRRRTPQPFLSLPTSCKSSDEHERAGRLLVCAGQLLDFAGAFEPADAARGLQPPSVRPRDQGRPRRPGSLKAHGHHRRRPRAPGSQRERQGLASSSVKIDRPSPSPRASRSTPRPPTACRPAQRARSASCPVSAPKRELLFTPTLPEAFCPDAAKIGTVKIISPLLPKASPSKARLYLATPRPTAKREEPLRLADRDLHHRQGPGLGHAREAPRRASLDPNTGQITTTFENSPQAGLRRRRNPPLRRRTRPAGDPRRLRHLPAPARPSRRGRAPPPVSSSSSFQITSGPSGSPCPARALPFAPSLAAGTTNINAGSFTPSPRRSTAKTETSRLQAVSLHMPPGLSGILKGVALCPEADANAGSCPPQQPDRPHDRLGRLRRGSLQRDRRAGLPHRRATRAPPSACRSSTRRSPAPLTSAR